MIEPKTPRGANQGLIKRFNLLILMSYCRAHFVLDACLADEGAGVMIETSSGRWHSRGLAGVLHTISVLGPGVPPPPLGSRSGSVRPARSSFWGVLLPLEDAPCPYG